MDRKIIIFFFLICLLLAQFALTVGCDCGGDDDDDDAAPADDDATDDDTTDDDITDDDAGDDDVIDDDTIDDDTIDDDTIDDDTTDDDTTDDDTTDDDTGDDDTYPTHEEIFNISGNVLLNGSSAIIEEWGLSGSGYFSCRLTFVDTTTQENTVVWPSWDVEPGEPNYCISLLGGVYEVWISWSGYNNDTFQSFQYVKQLSAGLTADEDLTFGVDHTLYSFSGNIVNHTPEPVQYQKVWLFAPTADDEAKLAEKFEYYDYTDDSGDYAMAVPAGVYTFSVDVYDIGFDVLPYFEDGIGVAAATTKDATLAQISTGSEVSALFTVNGEAPSARYETVDGKMTLYDTTHRVRYWDFCDGDCTIYAPDGSYQQQLELAFGNSSGDIFSVDMDMEFDGTVAVIGTTSLTTQNVELVEVDAMVTDYTGAAFADVTVEGSWTSTASADFTATTGIGGAYHVDLPVGNYTITFTPPASSPYPYTETSFNESFDVEAAGDFAFPAGYATLDGTMTINGDPLTDYFPALFTFAAVQLLDEQYNPVRQLDIDPLTGMYTGVVPYGTYDLRAIYQSAHTIDDENFDYLIIYWPQYVSALTIGEDLTQDVNLPLYEIGGTVRNWDYAPFELARAYFETEIAGLDDLVVFAEANADAAGEYSTWLPGATYDIEFIPLPCRNLIPLSPGQRVIDADTTLNFRFR